MKTWIAPLCQPFARSSAVKSSHASLMIHKSTLPFPWYSHCGFAALGFLVLRMHRRWHTSRSCGTVLAKVCYTLPDDKSTHVSERLRETVLPCPYFNALGHACTRTITSAAKMRDKEGNSVSLRLIFMLGSRLVGLDSAFCSSHLQMK